MENPTNSDGGQGRFVIPAAAIAASLACQAAVSAPGDLDASFGDVGRARLPPDLKGAVWSLEAAVDGEYTYAGGDEEYCYYGYYDTYDACVEDGFFGSLAASGLPSAGFALSALQDIDLRAVTRQADRKLVVVGRKETPGFGSLMAFRLMPDGSRDTAFGNSGEFVLDGDQYSVGRSVEVGVDGRIVVAGIDADQLVVLRLTTNGVLDESFGAGGVFRGPYVFDEHEGIEIAPSPNGGYRVLSGTFNSCVVTAITSSGSLDAQFGQLGSVTVISRDGSRPVCSAMAAQPDGNLVIGGLDGSGALAVKLRADGSNDPTFVGTEVQGALGSIVRLATQADGSVIAAATERDYSPGALVVRLRPDGSIDPAYGIAGRARIDLESAGATVAQPRVIRVLRNGGVLVGGGSGAPYSNKLTPFVARLVATGGGPGVLGFSAFATEVSEADQRAIVRVRRSGGVTGAVSVSYETEAGVAQPGQDFSAVSGRLDWADGDSSERSIMVPIAAGDASNEAPERFKVLLKGAGGGAGIGTGAAEVLIRGDGYPNGVLSIESVSPRVTEPTIPGSALSLQVLVRRENYTEGSVSVIVSPQSGSAMLGDDFQFAPVTLNWVAGEGGDKVVIVAVYNDRMKESEETFSVVLSAPTGGAILGTSSVAIAITDLTAPKKNSGGGGHTGLLGLLLLGIARLWRRRPG